MQIIGSFSSCNYLSSKCFVVVKFTVLVWPFWRIHLARGFLELCEFFAKYVEEFNPGRAIRF